MLGKMDIPLHGKCLRLTNYKNIKQEEPRVILCLVFLFVCLFFFGGGYCCCCCFSKGNSEQKKKSFRATLNAFLFSNSKLKQGFKAIEFVLFFFKLPSVVINTL